MTPASKLPAAISARGLGKRFGDRWAVAGLSFEIAAGEVFGLLGPNGAGKTTTLRMLAGMIAPDEGAASIAGLDVARDADEVRARVGLLTEQPGLYDRLTIGENLEFFARLHGVPSGEAGRRIDGLLRRFDLHEARGRRAGTLSKGMRQKVAIARALLHEPEVIFLDEPTSSLDPEAARTVRDSVAALASSGRTLLLCTHNLFEAEQLCRRIAILRPGAGKSGRLVAEGDLARRRDGRGVVIELAGEAAPFVAAARAVAGVASAEAEGARLTLAAADGAPSPVPDAIAALVAAGARIEAVVPRRVALEDAYLAVVAEEGAS